jgi:hypothetical protein
MDRFLRLCDALAALDWKYGDWASTHGRAEDILGAAWGRKAELMRALQERVRSFEMPQITRTAELHSWMLINGGDWMLKLNQFIPSPATGRHSENVHDHTRVITSLTLAGGYTQDFFDPAELRGRYQLGDRFRLEELPSAAGPSTRAGMVYSMGTNLFHALNGFDDGTLTLCLYGRIVKDGITVFNTVSGRVEQRITYGAARDMMLQQLHGLEEQTCGAELAVALGETLHLTSAAGGS